jgi:NADPH:quinone reductase-like Zn-dependent oxidoreductase
MKAMRIHQYGPTSVMQLDDVPPPRCGHNDVLIRVAASGVNPIDWKIRAGLMAQAMPLSLPLTLGWECAGTVEEVGSLVTAFQPCDTVFTMAAFHRGGTYAELVLVDAAEVAHMPHTVSFSVAAALPMTAQAAWTAVETADLQSGQHVLVHGGAGGVGSLAIQLAKARGARVSTTVAGGDVKRAKALGADTVIDFSTSNFTQQLRGLDAVIDTVGGPTQDASWATLKSGGILVALTQPPSQDRARAAGARGQFILTQPRGAVLQQIATLVDAGQLHPLRCHAYPLTDAALVHAHGEAKTLVGRTVLNVPTED